MIQMIKNFLEKLRKKVVVLVIGVGGVITVIFSGGFRANLPTDIQSIGQLHLNNPAAFEVLIRLHDIAEKTSGNEKTCEVGLAPQKIGSEAELTVLEGLGYIQRFQREEWNAVVIPCNRQQKIFKDVDSFFQFLKDQEPTPIVTAPVSSTSTQ
jgi:hypothetical protein